MQLARSMPTKTCKMDENKLVVFTKPQLEQKLQEFVAVAALGSDSTVVLVSTNQKKECNVSRERMQCFI